MKNSASSFDVIILAGGFGSRLRPVLPDTQKVLAPVGGHPFIFRIFDLLARQNIRRIVLALGYRAADAIPCLADWESNFSLEIIPSIEESPLGTAGAVRHALSYCQEEKLLVFNGDSWVNVDILKLLETHERCAGDATLTVVHSNDVGRYGTLTWSPQTYCVNKFIEKSPRHAGQPGWINAGVYALQHDLLANLPALTPMSLENDVLPALSNGRLFANPVAGPFIDIGLPESYSQSEDFFKVK